MFSYYLNYFLKVLYENNQISLVSCKIWSYDVDKMEAKYTNTCDKVLKEKIKIKKNHSNFKLCPSNDNYFTLITPSHEPSLNIPNTSFL